MSPILALTLWQIGYAILSMAHNFLFVFFLLSIIRLFIGRFHPLAALIVGVYTFANAVYGGCPLLELQNLVAQQAGAPLSVIGLAYEPFGMGEYGIRFVLCVISLLLVYVAYAKWDDPINKINWSNLFRSRTLTIW
jgi:hypothetical protein